MLSCRQDCRAPPTRAASHHDRVDGCVPGGRYENVALPSQG